ncbi:MAG: NAD(P)-dependent oxidoreductase [Ekhidna sp.]
MSEISQILIADEMHESIVPLLKDAGYDPVYSPLITRSEILESIHHFKGIIIRSKTHIDKELIDLATSLQFVARAGAGMDKVDEEYLNEKGIKAINAPEGNRDSLGEHALGMLLSLMHKINSSYDQVKDGEWNRERNRGIELKGKVVGIYGVGHMGMSFAKKIRGLECDVIGYDKFKSGFSNEFISEVELDEFFKKTEILSLHIPLNEETRQFFDVNYFKKFKNLKVFLNTARGEIVNTKGLISMLENGTLWGVALDVLENEKPTSYSKEEKEGFEKLTSFTNVIVTPHVGGWTYESYQRINEVLVDKMKDLF